MRRVLLVCVCFWLLAACSRPTSPTLVPERAELSSIGPQGVGMLVHIAAQNPNTVDLTARTVTASVVLDGQVNMGTVTMTTPLSLPAKSTTELAVPLTLAWNDVPTLLRLAMANRPIPYQVNGALNLGGNLLNVDVPFTMAGSITHEQLVQATAHSLPPL